MGKALDRLIDLLDLEQIEVNIFRGRSPEERVQRVFGGQVAGQALVAAGRTVPPDRPVHSLQAYFIRPGDPAVPIVYLVDRVRDGRSFTTRRVSAVQHGETIFTLSASFHHPEPGPEHADPMPDVPPPESVERNSDRLARLLGQVPPQVRESPIDLRSIGPMSAEAAGDPSLRTTRNLIWLRVDGDLPDDPLLHVCLMTYASDLTLLDSVLLGRQPGPRHVVPPAVPGRSLAAVRAGVTGGLRRSGPGPRRGVHGRRRAGRLGHAGRADPVAPQVSRVDSRSVKSQVKKVLPPIGGNT
jgi:acyl-CoA thioesterase-2